MENDGGVWIMRGLEWNNPYRIRSWRELVHWINEVGFLPLFANEIAGFSVEEHVSPNFWWTGNVEQDPWEWREIIARSHQIAYGKFFGKKAGFISADWLSCFVNARRNGYDFDSRWEEGLANHREKLIMDFYLGEDDNGDTVWKAPDILTTDLKRLAGFGKGGEKNFPGIVTDLQMKLYLVIGDFRRRTNKKGGSYGMSVSVMQPPETIWGYEMVTERYTEAPAASWERIFDHVKELYPAAKPEDIIALIGKRP